MLCFRDMTFCDANCKTPACPSKFDIIQEAAAKRWWGGDGAPVAFSDYSKSCADFTPTEPNQ